MDINMQHVCPILSSPVFINSNCKADYKTIFELTFIQGWSSDVERVSQQTPLHIPSPGSNKEKGEQS